MKANLKWFLLGIFGMLFAYAIVASILKQFGLANVKMAWNVIGFIILASGIATVLTFKPDLQIYMQMVTRAKKAIKIIGFGLLLLVEIVAAIKLCGGLAWISCGRIWFYFLLSLFITWVADIEEHVDGVNIWWITRKKWFGKFCF